MRSVFCARNGRRRVCKQCAPFALTLLRAQLACMGMRYRRVASNLIRLVLAIAIPVAVAGCGVTCPTVVNPGIVVEVREAGSGRPAASGALGLVFRGTVVADTLRSNFVENDSSAATLTSWRIGTGRYRVTIERPGFATWTRDNVEVMPARGDCGGLRTTYLRADLTIDSP